MDSHVDVVCQLLSEVLVAPNETEGVLLKSKCLRVSRALDAVNDILSQDVCTVTYVRSIGRSAKCIRQ